MSMQIAFRRAVEDEADDVGIGFMQPFECIIDESAVLMPRRQQQCMIGAGADDRAAQRGHDGAGVDDDGVELLAQCVDEPSEPLA